MSELILALDLATQLGYAQGRAGEKPEHNSIDLRHGADGSGVVFGRFMNWMAMRLIEKPPDLICFEAPLAPSVMAGRTTKATGRILWGLPAIAEGMGFRRRIAVFEADVSDVRQHFIGRRNLKGKIAKQQVFDRCKMLGLNPIDQNASDALAILDYVQSIRSPAYAALTTDLWAGR